MTTIKNTILLFKGGGFVRANIEQTSNEDVRGLRRAFPHPKTFVFAHKQNILIRVSPAVYKVNLGEKF